MTHFTWKNVKYTVGTMALAAAGLGAFFWASFERNKGYNEATPKRVWCQDVDSDGREDIVIENNAGERSIFLQAKDGTYRLLPEYLENINSQNENMVRKTRASIDEKVNALK